MAEQTGAKSWQTTLGGILAGLGGVGALIAQMGFADTAWGQKLTAICGAIFAMGTAWGLVKAKDANVTGAGKDAKEISN